MGNTKRAAATEPPLATTPKLGLPWKVAYERLCEEWHPQSRPRVVDKDGRVVLWAPQFVGHPGEYDQQADMICRAVVAAVNAPSAPV